LTPFKKFFRNPKIGNGSSFSNLSTLLEALEEKVVEGYRIGEGSVSTTLTSAVFTGTEPG
jgi:hypothetical protein